MASCTVFSSLHKAIFPCVRGGSFCSLGGESCSIFPRHHLARSLFTNAHNLKKDDLYAVLGLSWGDGATSTEIKNAYKRRSALLHPDVNTTDPPHIAQQKFQQLQRAYETLTKSNENINSEERIEEWRFSIWNRGDRIACDRTDVAGAARQRPVPPAPTTEARRQAGLQLGHPSGRGAAASRNEYLGNGGKISSSVGRGQNKWVKPKEYKPWNGSLSESSHSSTGSLGHSGSSKLS